MNATSVALEGRAPSRRKSLPLSELHSPAADRDSPAATHEATQHRQTSSPPGDQHRSQPDEPTGVTTQPTPQPSPRPTRSLPTASHNPTGSPAPAPPHAHAPHEGACRSGHLSILHLGQSLHQTRGSRPGNGGFLPYPAHTRTTPSPTTTGAGTPTSPTPQINNTRPHNLPRFFPLSLDTQQLDSAVSKHAEGHRPRPCLEPTVRAELAHDAGHPATQRASGNTKGPRHRVVFHPVRHHPHDRHLTFGEL
jgi:hypothetical protein